MVVPPMAGAVHRRGEDNLMQKRTMIPTLQAMCRRPDIRGGEKQTSAKGNFKQHGMELNSHPKK